MALEGIRFVAVRFAPLRRCAGCTPCAPPTVDSHACWNRMCASAFVLCQCQLPMRTAFNARPLAPDRFTFTAGMPSKRLISPGLLPQPLQVSHKLRDFLHGWLSWCAFNEVPTSAAGRSRAAAGAEARHLAALPNELLNRDIVHPWAPLRETRIKTVTLSFHLKWMSF
jgi:hypothetical protein